MKANLLEYAKKFMFSRCPKCDALPGDPCRTRQWKITRPHKARQPSWAIDAAKESKGGKE